MSHRVLLETRAKKELEKLPKEVVETLAGVLDDLGKNPRPPGAKKLAGAEGFRIRKGDYRILYLIDDGAKEVRVYRIGHRKDVYRGI